MRPEVEVASGPLPPAVAIPSEGSRGRVLLVEDEPALRRAYARILENGGYDVEQAGDGPRAIDLLSAEEGGFDIVLTDISMPGMSGTQLLRAIRERDVDVPVLLVTASPTVESAIEAVEHGALRYLIKPISPRDLVEAVDRATRLGRIARVKRESANYLASVGEPADEHMELEATLRSALGSLWMMYQPIVDWTNQRIVAFEALVRTGEPSVPHPGALFDLAEKLGAVREIGRAIRASVARTMTDNPLSVDVFVNLHPDDLLDDDLFSPDAPLTAFASRVVLEVTERQALDESAGIAARAARLRKLGYRVAIDDLGAGYAGLTYFAQLSPEVVKIDMSLVRGIHRDPLKQKLVGSLIRLCSELGMLVVVEGVETVDERDAVVALGGELLQGYLFARPGPPFPKVTW